MSLKYQELSPEQEKFVPSPFDSSSTLGEFDDLDFDTSPREDVYHRPAGGLTQRVLSSKWLWLVHIVMMVSSLTILALAVNVRSSTLKHVQEFSAWSPAASSVQYDAVRYNTSTKDNRFVGAGPEVDKAWREISYDVGDQWLSKDDLVKLDMPETSVKVDHPETGEEGYRVGVEVFHQLHCLNLLRRVTYKEYYEPLGGEFAHGPEALQKHTDHCIEILRLNTQCNADIGVFTLYMIEGDPLAWPELNSKHVCRNFDKVRSWALDNSVGNMEVL